MKKFYFIYLAMFLFACPLVTQAAHNWFAVDSIYYMINSRIDSTVTVTYQGSSQSQYSDEYKGEVIIPETIIYQGGTYRVTEIGKDAFCNCDEVTKVTLPNSITSIRSYAFYKCSRLKSVIMSEKLKTIERDAFYDCESLTSITIPNSVTSIGQNAFGGCTKLTAVHITDIAAWCNIAFSDDKYISNPLYYAKKLYLNGESVTNLVIPNSVKNIKARTFEYCKNIKSITIPSSVTSIGDYAFNNCDSLVTVTVANDTIHAVDAETTIGNYAFVGCDQLQNATIGSVVKSIGSYAFQNCKKLSSLTLNNGLTSIGASAVRGCTTLTKIVIPNSVKYISAEAFSGCTNLTDITLSDNLQSMGADVFSNTAWWNSNPDGIVYLNNWLIGYKYIKASGDFEIPLGTKGVADNAFEDCGALTSIVIPESIVGIGNSAFSGCDNLIYANINCKEIGSCFKNGSLQEVFLGENVAYVGEKAFYNCDSLKKVTISSNVIEIKESAFYSCGKLTNVISHATAAPQLGTNVFSNIASTATLTYPGGSNYSAWAKYFNTMIEDNSEAMEQLQSLLNEAQTLHDNSVEGDTNGTYPAGSKASLKAVIDEVNTTLAGDCNHTTINECQEKLNSAIDNFKAQLITIYDNKLQIADTTAVIGSQIALSVKMENSAAITGFQFDLVLPDGFNIATDKDGYELIELSTERTTLRKHTCDYVKMNNGATRVICYSNSNATFSGNSGEVITITINVANNLLDGDYTVELKNTILTEVGGTTKYEVPLMASTVSVSTYMLGDVNNDKSIDVADVSGLVSLILNSTTPGLNVNAADVNQDAAIDVADVSNIINIILGNESVKAANTRALTRSVTGTETAGNTLFIEPFSINAGEEKNIEVLMNNAGDAFTSLQFDLTLPEGIEVVTEDGYYLIDLGSRTSSRKHVQPEAAVQSDGSLRVLTYSNKNDLFSGESGDVLVITVKAADNIADGTYELGMKNIILARPDATKDNPADSTVEITVGTGTSIHNSVAADGNGWTVYTTSGIKLLETTDKAIIDNLPAGIYIINNRTVVVK